MQVVDTDSKYDSFLWLIWFQFSHLASGDITMDEFTIMMNQYVPTSTLGLRDLYNTFGKREKK
jgi:hypothetical protein